MSPSSYRPPFHRPLCPSCGGEGVRIASTAAVYFDVVYDAALQDLVVTAETFLIVASKILVDDADWDEQSGVTCGACGWRGEVGGLGL